eukprot:NODE_7180_length_499_cov_20.342222_g6741_i0.p1 GENE.NODE_7180_length_499_cov_20.342222_g6741_i0~~NODE_7180_length_499_cov_20.342222_g6741_i0.p1  ORF type:complete len:106 (-),score=5.77 NODE_7180_length_499_cov_20.342222_g6741_i0:50-367(-)
MAPYKVCVGRRRELSAWLFHDIPLRRIVREQLFDQVDMGQDHATAAVALQSNSIQRLTICVVILTKALILFELVPYHLSAGEAAHGNDHGKRKSKRTGAKNEQTL